MKQRAFYDLMTRVEPFGIDADTLETLLKAERTLHRWAVLECGDGNNFASWSIQRDDKTDKPFRCVYPHRGESYRVPIADRETAALKRVKAICDRLGLHFYHQTDPRGCALYIDKEPLSATNYTKGVAICL